jgi:hypothetical protein
MTTFPSRRGPWFELAIAQDVRFSQHSLSMMTFAQTDIQMLEVSPYHYGAVFEPPR